MECYETSMGNSTLAEWQEGGTMSDTNGGRTPITLSWQKSYNKGNLVL